MVEKIQKLIANEPKIYHSYRDKLKNGLSLVKVFELEDYCATFEVFISNLKVDENTTSIVENIDLNTEDFIESFHYEMNEPIESDIFTKKRKGKWIPLKKPVASNFKKNRRKQLGYSDKLFNLEQNTKVKYEDEDEYENEYEEDNWYDDDYSYSGHRHIVPKGKKGNFWFTNNYHLDTWYD
jgi:hypothetical protein